MKETATHIYFWGTYLSNWYSCSFSDDKYTYKTSESYLMAHKALLFNDIAIANKIIKSSDPKDQKALGRTVSGFNEDLWNLNKFDIMVAGLSLKFAQNNELKLKLLATCDKILVEGSPYDRIWGVGLKFDNPLILDEKNWLGENLLGKALMVVRSKLKEENV
jgi:ribA/ribD-fused uncharacterized protein